MFNNRVLMQLKGQDYRFALLKDDVEYYLKDEGLTEADVVIQPFSEATPDELAEAIGGELENENYHSLVSVADNVLQGLKAEGVEEDIQRKVLNVLGSALLNGI